MNYDAFISYSHAADGHLAPAVQRGLQRLARPWHRIRALHVFRDDTGLAVNPHLWASIAAALDGSAYFVLLASPEAAASPWVNREIEHWVAHKPAETILPVLTDGTLTWDAATSDYDAAASSALPPALVGRFSDEPRHLDLRWARNETQLDLRHSHFREAIADLAAPMHHLPKEELESEDIRHHRRALRLARGAVVLLVILLLVATVAGGLAVRNAGRAQAAKRTAQHEANTAIARQLAANALNALHDHQSDLALLLALEANRIDPRAQTRGSLLSALLDEPRLRTQLHGFASPPVSLSFSPNGRELGAADGQGRIRLWDVASGRALPHQPDVRGNDIAFSPNGNVLAVTFTAPTPGAAATIMLWDVAAGRPLAHQPAAARVAAPNHLSSPAFSPDGSLLAAGAADGTKLWRTATGELLWSLPADDVAALAFSLDGSLLATAATKQEPGATVEVLQLWDTRTGRSVGSQLRGAEEPQAPPLCTLTLSPDAKRLTSCSLASWDTSTGRQAEAPTDLGRALVGSDRVLVASSATSHSIASRSYGDGSVRLHDPITGAVEGQPFVVPYEFQNFPEGTVAFSPDGSALAVWGGDGAIWLFDAVARGSRLATPLPGSFDGKMAASPDGLRVALLRTGPNGSCAGTSTCSVTLIDGRTGQPLSHQSIPNGVAGANAAVSAASTTTVNAFAISPNGKAVAVGFSDGSLALWNSASGAALVQRLSRPNCVNGITTLAFTVNSRQLAIGCHSGEGSSLGLVELQDLSSVRAAPGPPMAIGGVPTTLAFSPDGRVLVVGVTESRTSMVQVLDLKTRRPLAHQPGAFDSPLIGLALSPNSRTLAVGLAGRTELWDLRAGRLRATLGRPAANGAVAFSPDGKTLASGTVNNEVRLWDVGNGQPVGNPLPGQGCCAALAFAADGKTLLTGFAPEPSGTTPTSPGAGGLLRWNLGMSSWVRQACVIANRNLTRSEWQLFVGPTLPYRKTCGSLP